MPSPYVPGTPTLRARAASILPKQGEGEAQWRFGICPNRRILSGTRGNSRLATAGDRGKGRGHVHVECMPSGGDNQLAFIKGCKVTKERLTN